MRFCEYFKIDTENIEFLDIDLEGDYPFFIDPLLLNFTEQLEGSYEKFLNYFKNNKNCEFKEIKNTHLGFGNKNNSGRGIGKKLGSKIAKNSYIAEYAYDLDTIEIFTEGIGVDLISDMTTNIILKDLVDFTVKMCEKYKIKTEKVRLEISESEYKYYNLPFYNTEYIILVPRDILRKDSMLLTKKSFVNNIHDILKIKSNDEAKMSLENLLYKEVYQKTYKKTVIKKRSKKEINKNLKTIIEVYPKIINNFKDYIIETKPDSNVKDSEIEEAFIENKLEIINGKLNENFPEKEDNVDIISEIRNFINYYKNEIENTDLVKDVYFKKEAVHQRLFRTLGKSKIKGFNSEVNNGTGPVDFKVVRGEKSYLIEFKLMSNSKVKNVFEQIKSYEKANLETIYSFVCLIAYDQNELKRGKDILENNHNDKIEVIIINSNITDYKSASKK